MKKIRVMHIAGIDNDKSKGTSVMIPQCIQSQFKSNLFEVCFINCNNIYINELKTIKNNFTKSQNSNMKIFEKFNPDIVVFHELYKPYFLKLYRYLCKNNIPYIIIPHGGMSKIAQNKKMIKKMIANLLLFNNFFKNASAIQYLSEKEKK